MTKVEAFVAPKSDDPVVEGFEDYSSSSSLHGIRFVGSKGSSRVQRTFWGLLMCFSTAALLWQIVDVGRELPIRAISRWYLRDLGIKRSRAHLEMELLQLKMIFITQS